MNKNIRGVLILFAVFALVGCAERADTGLALNEQTIQATEVSDKDKILDAFDANTQAFHAMVEGLTAEQLAFRESPERWSIAEVAEHMVRTESGLREMAMAVIEGEPVFVPPDSTTTDSAVLDFAEDRSVLMTAPVEVRPTGMFETVDEILAAFNSTRESTIDLIESTDVDLRSVYGRFGPLGYIDGTQWLLFIAGHANRHVAQMQQVKDDPAFPHDAL